MVAYLLAINDVDVDANANALTPKGEPPVIQAVSCHQLDCLQVLLEDNATDVNRANGRGDALIHTLLAPDRRSFWTVFEKTQQVSDFTKKTPKQMATEVGWADVAAKLSAENRQL
jgi:hypothetical protein